MSGVWSSGHRFRDSNKATFYQLRLLLRSYLLQRFVFDEKTERPDQDSQERRVDQVSGAGLVSIRLPRSVMEAFEADAMYTGIDRHEAARRLISCLGTVTDDHLVNLAEPPKESENPRLSLYLGWPHAQTLATVPRRTQLSVSCIVRRLIYGLAVTRAITVSPTGHVHRCNPAP